MKKILLSVVVLSFVFASCDKEDDMPMELDYQYHVHIHSPDDSNKHVDDSVHFHVAFESHTGETIHHVSIRVYNKEDGTEIYNKPDSKHVSEADGILEFNDDFVQTEANGVVGHTNWIFEAKVWAH